MTLVHVPARVLPLCLSSALAPQPSHPLVDFLQEPSLGCLGYLSQHGILWSRAILLRYRERGSSKILEQDANSPAIAPTRFHNVIINVTITRKFLEDILSRL